MSNLGDGILGDGDEGGFVLDPELAMQAVNDAGVALIKRCVDLESISGGMTLVFVTDLEATEILAALQARPDSAVKRVLVEMYEMILEEDKPDG